MSEDLTLEDRIVQLEKLLVTQAELNVVHLNIERLLASYVQYVGQYLHIMFGMKIPEFIKK